MHATCCRFFIFAHVFYPETAAHFRETVPTGNVFQKTGDYQIRLQQGDRIIGEGLFTVADDEHSAVVNACIAE